MSSESGLVGPALAPCLHNPEALNGGVVAGVHTGMDRETVSRQ